MASCLASRGFFAPIVIENKLYTISRERDQRLLCFPVRADAFAGAGASSTTAAGSSASSPRSMAKAVFGSSTMKTTAGMYADGISPNAMCA